MTMLRCNTMRYTSTVTGHPEVNSNYSNPVQAMLIDFWKSNFISIETRGSNTNSERGNFCTGLVT